MKPDSISIGGRNWEERKAVFERNMQIFSDEELSKLSHEQQFFKMNLRNAPKNLYDYHFDSSFLCQGVKPNTKTLGQIHLQFGRDIDISTKGLESLDCPVMLAYGRFDFAVPPVQSWDPLRSKFKNLTIRIFEKSSHSPQYEQPDLFDAELLNWLREN